MSENGYLHIGGMNTLWRLRAGAAPHVILSVIIVGDYE